MEIQAIGNSNCGHKCHGVLNKSVFFTFEGTKSANELVPLAGLLNVSKHFILEYAEDKFDSKLNDITCLNKEFQKLFEIW